MANRKPTAEKIEAVAREQFGFETLRPGQLEAVQGLLERRDTLVVQPTGSGKSAIYQIAGLLMDGATLIVSPLIALQKDQVDSIAGLEAAAAAMNSTRRVSELDEEVQEIEQGRIEFIFMAPEQLRKPETIETLQRAQVSLFVVDEAHCISQWGHDFRPDYLHLGNVIEALGHPVVLAMTATAGPEVRDEIVERLRMRNPAIRVRDLDRPNIYLRVDSFDTEDAKLQAVLHRVLWAGKPGIVYVATRKSAQQIRHALDAEGVRSAFYHGGLSAKLREGIHEEFMSGKTGVIVATNAFGMGIDKPDIRFVYHYDVPESLDSYYQEIGRAGRDGMKAEATLFFRSADIGAQSYKTAQARVDPVLLERILGLLNKGEISVEELAGQTQLTPRKLMNTIQQFEYVGAVEWTPDGHVAMVGSPETDAVIELVTKQRESRRLAARHRLEQMRSYAVSKMCRRELLLRYLGEEYTGPCNACDNCEAASGAVRVDPTVGERRAVS